MFGSAYNFKFVLLLNYFYLTLIPLSSSFLPNYFSCSIFRDKFLRFVEEWHKRKLQSFRNKKKRNHVGTYQMEFFLWFSE